MILEIIYSVAGNLVLKHNIQYTYVDEDEPRMGILSDAAFENFSTENGLKCYTPVQLIFGHGTIISS